MTDVQIKLALDLLATDAVIIAQSVTSMIDEASQIVLSDTGDNMMIETEHGLVALHRAMTHLLDATRHFESAHRVAK